VSFEFRYRFEFRVNFPLILEEVGIVMFSSQQLRKNIRYSDFEFYLFPPKRMNFFNNEFKFINFNIRKNTMAEIKNIPVMFLGSD